MGELRNINPKAYNWLVVIPRSSWCKHAFNIYPRCDVLIICLNRSIVLFYWLEINQSLV